MRQRESEYMRIGEDEDMRAVLGLWNAPITLHSSDRARPQKS